ncbi:MAG TPA: NADH-quinone oxidoreductase subunit NuoH [Bacteroidetes bacterium]|nr:NADH-quinone oxidoreductase subunit NuoH [Bacteroidota bacterium]
MYDFSKITSAIHEWLSSLMPSFWVTTIEWIIIGVVFLALFALLGLILVIVERRIAGFFQFRLGPNRVGPQGMFQTVADTVKLLLKELVSTDKVDKFLYNVAPFFVIIAPLMIMAVIPYGLGLTAYDINIGLFFVMAVSSIGVVGILLAGWSSNNKYSLIGAMRSGAVIISYELSMGLSSLLAIVLLAGSLNLNDIVMSQQAGWWLFRGHIPAIIAFVIYIITGTAETNRVPFDLTEAESELGAGFHAEYSGIKFAFFFLSEFVNMFIIAALATTIFLGGWLPIHIPGWEGFNNVMDYIPSPIWFFLKTSVIIFLLMWFRWTFPRLRIDQILTLEWKYLLPLSLINLVLMAFVVMMGWVF